MKKTERKKQHVRDSELCFALSLSDLTSPEFLETGHRVMRISPDLNN